MPAPAAPPARLFAQAAKRKGFLRPCRPPAPVAGAHRLATAIELGWQHINAEALRVGLGAGHYRLLELQENLAANPLTGAERKAAAEVGEIWAKLNEVSQEANGPNNWFVEMAQTTGTLLKTLTNWWSSFN